MGNYGEIKAGMKFSSYLEFDSKLEKKANKSKTLILTNNAPEYLDKSNLESATVYNIKCIQYNGYKDNKGDFIGHTGKGYSNGNYVIFGEDAQSGLTHSKTVVGGRNVYEMTKENFNYIEGKTQYAVDKNGDGIVQENEIFDYDS